MKIGETELPLGLILAPMAGFTDGAFRRACRAFGAEYTVTEMISAKALVMGDKKTHALAKISEAEAPCALQLFGHEPDVLARAAAVLEKGEAGGVAPVVIDLNMGCPVEKIFANGEGSALMKNPDLINAVTSAVTRATGLPVTVKLRAGVDRAHVNAVECAQAAEAGGASMIAVHGRTRTEMYGGTVDLSVIRAVKDAVRIPVVASGDVTDGESAVRTLAETHADGLMIGRGALGNPFVFAEIAATLRGEVYTPPTLAERMAVAREQFLYNVAEKGEYRAVREGRGQISLYVRAVRGAAAIRQRIVTAKTKTDVLAALDAACTLEDL